MAKLKSIRFPGLPNAYTVPQDGTQMNVDDSASVPQTISEALETKLDKAQGVSHAGEFVIVGSDGNITTMALSVWEGGEY